MARRNARKRQWMPNNEFHRKRKNDSKSTSSTTSPYPKSIKIHDRFFGCLLSSSIQKFRDSESNAVAYQQLMQLACSLLGVPCIPTPAKLLNSPLSKKLRTSKDSARSHHLLQRSCSTSLLDASSSSCSYSTPSSTFDNAREYYMSKAPLILEESRYIISESIAKKASTRRDICSFRLELISMEERYPNLAYNLRQYAPTQLIFRIVDTSCKETSSAKYTRPGSVFLLNQHQLQQKSKKGKSDDDTEFSVLACVVPSYQTKTKTEDENTLSLMIFNRDGIDINQLSEGSGSDNDTSSSVKGKVIFHGVFLCTLISYLRQMEACLRQAKVPFMQKLLGQKDATHIRFNDSSEDEEVEITNDTDNDELHKQEGYYVDDDGTTDNTIEDDDEEYDVDERNSSLVALIDKLPKLNPTQERAAKNFLESKDSLHLVQGPPGTGKSTFLVNVICRRLAKDKYARILVTAPTNRAVTVLAQRFLDVVNSCNNDDLLSDCNALLIGVEDKLISTNTSSKNECISVDTLPPSLQSIFVYTWIDSIKNEYIDLLKMIKSSRSNLSRDIVKNATNISNKLSSSLPNANTVIHCSWMIVQQLTIALQGDMYANEESSGLLESPVDTAINQIEQLLDAVDDYEEAVPQLLSTAKIIFCTLSTAGASILKQTRKIDDLLIDEAACATESEIAIPFHLRPNRCLAVGDPQQLPATIMSPHAASLGLSVSMHDRLMNGCSRDFVMLDQQYRMKPQISLFPNCQFYSGKLTDGKNVTSESYLSRFALKAKGPYSFVDVSDGIEYKDSGGSYTNKEECDVVVDLVERIASNSKKTNLGEDKLRVITFYNGQANLLKRLLARKGLRACVATVDSSQGCEADVVIVSFVRSSRKKGVHHATGFLGDERRINVALTRARHQLICVGNATGTLRSEGSEVLKSLVLDAEKRGCIV